LFQSRDVGFHRNVLRINDKDVPRGIPVNPDGGGWNGNVVLIPPNFLTGVDRLRIQARNRSGEGGGNLDDFLIDNMVILYRTRSPER
jgi:hypothetical protein